MRSYKGLSSKILTLDNFRLAYKNAIKGKGFYKEVKDINKTGADQYLRGLLEEVKSRRYEVSPYETFIKKTEEKERIIYKLPMKDRIVQHAIMNVCEPLFRKTFINDTYSSIKGRGIHLGHERVKKFLRKHPDYLYCMKLDIRKCYPSLDKEVLKEKLNKKFRDEFVQWIFAKIVDSCEHGVPIGNYTSQYFNNFYFSDFDHWIKETRGCLGYFRYCDDMVIFGRTKEDLRSLFAKIQNIMTARLHVHIKGNYQIFPVKSRGVNFLGYITYPDYVRVRKHVKRRFIEKLSNMNLRDLTDRNLNIVGSYWGIFVHANCRNLWYTYTGTRSYKEFKKRYRPEHSTKDILGLSIQICKIVRLNLHRRRGGRVVFKCRIKGDTNTPHYIHSNSLAIIHSIVERDPSNYPWNTAICRGVNNYFIFK